MIETEDSGLYSKLSSGFSSIKESPRELWCAYVIKFLESLSYFSFSQIFTLFLSANFGYTDVQAGTLYGTLGALVTLYGIASGFVIDNLGVSKSLKVGLCFSLIGRIAIYWTMSRSVLLFSLLFLKPLGFVFIIPVLVVGIRRYTNRKNSSFAFGLFYVIMNVGGLLAGPMNDYCTILYDGNKIKHDGGTWVLTGYRLILLIGVFANVLALITSLFIREIKVDSHEDGDEISGSNKVAEFHPIKGSARQVFRDVCYSPTFWRFMAVCFITLMVRMIFRHLDATLPKYIVREFGENVPKGTILSINPAIIIVLVPIMTAYFNHVDPLVMIHYGSYISALSVFILAMSTTVEACVLFVIVLSIGEAVWSPRFFDYCMSVVQEGREGTYLALSSAPMFLVKLPVGMMGGYLLQKYCPEEGERDSKRMWFIIGCTTIPSPILLTVFWKCLSNRSNHEVANGIDMEQNLIQSDLGSEESFRVNKEVEMS